MKTLRKIFRSKQYKIFAICAFAIILIYTVVAISAAMRYSNKFFKKYPTSTGEELAVQYTHLFTTDTIKAYTGYGGFHAPVSNLINYKQYDIIITTLDGLSLDSISLEENWFEHSTNIPYSGTEAGKFTLWNAALEPSSINSIAAFAVGKGIRQVIKNDSFLCYSGILNSLTINYNHIDTTRIKIYRNGYGSISTNIMFYKEKEHTYFIFLFPSSHSKGPKIEDLTLYNLMQENIKNSKDSL